MLLLAVARGEPFLGYPTRKGRVLIIAVEEHRRDIIKRLRKLGMRKDDLVRVWAKPFAPWMWPHLRQYIEKWHVKLVLVDTVNKYWAQALASENDNADVIRTIEPFLDLAHLTATAVLLNCHDRKGGGAFGESIRGASALYGLVDQALMLKRVKGHETHRLLKIQGRYDETPPALVLDYVPIPGAKVLIDAQGHRSVQRHYVNLGPPAGVAMREQRDRLVKAMWSGLKTDDELMKKTKIKRKRFDKLMKQLVGMGTATQRRRGHAFLWTLRKKAAL